MRGRLVWESMMPRVRFASTAFLLCAALMCVLPAHVRAEGEDEAATTPKLVDFGARDRKELVDAAREYLDPSVTSVYWPRKHFVAQLATLKEEKQIDALKDLDFLRQIINQGRGFLPDFSDKSWRKSNNVGYFKKDKGVYYNLKSERMRFTYVQPKKYPSERDFRKIPRDPPFPLLLTFHEQDDTYDSKGNAEEFPSQAVLMRRYPKKSFPDLYQDWFLLAPVVARAKWLEPHGAIKHGYSTSVLHRFWKHFNVDFDHIVLDGKEEAAALAAVYPLVFAGLVLHGGDINPSTVKNFASVPVFVKGDAKLEKLLKEAGHPDVTTGDDAALMTWLAERERKVPATFDWEIQLPDHVFANWIAVIGAEFASSGEGESGALNPTVNARRVDTAEEPNTLRIDTRGVEQISIWLNDDVVDLDREVRLVLNGEVMELGKLERSFSRVFELDPKIRSNMFFGWLYPVFAGPFRMPEPPEEPVEEAPPVEEAKGSPADEAKAKTFWNMAVAAEGEGNPAKAKALFGKIVEMEKPNSYKAKAEAKLAELAAE